MITAETAEQVFQAKQEDDLAKERYDALRDKAVMALEEKRTGKVKETVKIVAGRVVISVSYDDTFVSVAWHRVVERIKELHPKLGGAIASVMRGKYVDDKGIEKPYVNESPRATLTVKTTE